MNPISIGVVGAGLIGRQHVRRIQQDGDFRLVGIADTETHAVEAAFPGVPVFSDYRDLCDRAVPEAVVIATPNATHAPIGIECARRGIHILVEKPVADTEAAANDLVEAVREQRVVSLVGHHRRHHGQVARLRELIRNRAIGDIIGVSGLWATCKPEEYFRSAPWRTSAGGGPILINLVHEVDFLRFVIGEIASVESIVSNRNRHFAVEDTAGVLLSFDSGAIGTFLLSDCAVSPWTVEQGLGEAEAFPKSGQSTYRIIGTHGSLEFPGITLWKQPSDKRDWREPIVAETIDIPLTDPYAAQLKHFGEAVRGTAQSLQTVADGARTLAATLAIAAAAKAPHIEISKNRALQGR